MAFIKYFHLIIEGDLSLSLRVAFLINVHTHSPPLARSCTRTAPFAPSCTRTDDLTQPCIHDPGQRENWWGVLRSEWVLVGSFSWSSSPSANAYLRLPSVLARLRPFWWGLPALKYIPTASLCPGSSVTNQTLPKSFSLSILRSQVNTNWPPALKPIFYAMIILFKDMFLVYEV